MPPAIPFDPRQRERPERPWPKHLTPGDRLQRLYLLSPKAAMAIIEVVDDTLMRVWPKAGRPRRYGR